MLRICALNVLQVKGDEKYCDDIFGETPVGVRKSVRPTVLCIFFICLLYCYTFLVSCLMLFFKLFMDNYAKGLCFLMCCRVKERVCQS